MCFKSKKVKKTKKVKVAAKLPSWLCIILGGHVWTYQNGKKVCSRCGLEG